MLGFSVVHFIINGPKKKHLSLYWVVPYLHSGSLYQSYTVQYKHFYLIVSGNYSLLSWV